MRDEHLLLHPVLPLTVRTVGAGPPVVLVHGLPTDGRVWADVAAALPGWECRLVDLPGYGASPDDGGGVREHAAALRAVVPPGAHLVGMDYGGLLAAQVAAGGGARSLTLLSTALSWGWLPSVVAAMPPLDRPFYRRHAGDLFLATGARRDALGPFGGGGRARADRMARVARSLPRGWLPAAALRLPVLCLWGAEDRFLPPWMGRRLARALPDGRFEALPGRHLLPWDAPAAVAARLEAFWVSAGRGR